MDPEGRRPHKRRAAQACKSCRIRKVRCDLMSTGIPPGCTNCRLDGNECQLIENKRRRTIHRPRDERREGVLNETTNTAEPPQLNESRLSTLVHNEVSTVNESSASSSNLVGGLTSRAEIPSHRHTAPPGQRSTVAGLPLYVQDLPATLNSEDLEYLAVKGAFDLPTRHYLIICLCRYIEFVHPVLPLLNLNDTLISIDDETGKSGKISILLFFGIIYAALPFTENKHVRAVGYSSKLEARTVFYKKAKLLYDLNAELDQHVLIQTCLLMSTPPGSMDPIQDVWYWTGLAISHAQTVGLHLDIGHSDMDDTRRKWRRRLWWCCFIREHVVAMGLGRPSRITYYNVPMLSVGDFDWGMLPETVRSIPSQCPVARDLGRQQKLAIITVEKAKLCVCIRRAVSVMCSIRDGNYSKMPNNALSDALRESAFCAQDLENWVTMLPVEASYDIKGSETYSLDDRCLILARATLHMLFYDAICLLNRPRALAIGASYDGVDPKERAGEPRRLIRWAARELVRINSGLYELGLLPYVDATGVANVVAAIVVYLLDAKSSDAALREIAVRGLHQCIDFLRVLKDTYGSATHAFRFLEAAVKSEDFPTLRYQVSGRNEQMLRSRMRRINQVLGDFSPEEITEMPYRNGTTVAIPTPRASLQANEAEQVALDSLNEEYLIEDYIREDGWQIPNFGTLDLSMAFQEFFDSENHNRPFSHEAWHGDTTN